MDQTEKASGLQVVMAEGASSEPSIYDMAGKLRNVFHLSRAHQLSLWKHVVDLYAETGNKLPEIMRLLCHEPFVEDLLQNEIFWGLVGPTATREYRSRVSTLLPGVYATAALLSAKKDNLPLTEEEDSLLSEPLGAATPA